MSQEAKLGVTVDQADVDWYLEQGLTGDDARAEARDDALRDRSEDERDITRRGEVEPAEDPLAGDTDHWVHPDETRADA